MMTVCRYLVRKERHPMADSPNCESGQHGGNGLPCQRSVLSECSCYICIHCEAYCGNS